MMLTEAERTAIRENEVDLDERPAIMVESEVTPDEGYTAVRNDLYGLKRCCC